MLSAAGAVVLAGIGSLSDAGAATTSITITSGGCSGGGSSFCFNPESASTATGALVTWTNQSGVNHTATLCSSSACAGAPASSASCNNFNVSIGSSGSQKFTQPGTCYYYCEIHGYPAMHGLISVAQTVEQSSSRVAFDKWRGVTDSTANGGTYRTSSTKGSTAKFTFSGTGVTWVTRKGPNQGIASVSIDGVKQPNVDLYASSAKGFSQTYSGLASQSHAILITVTATKNSASSASSVAVDAFVVGSTTTPDSSTKVTYDNWTGKSSTSASGGSYRVSPTQGATSSLTFTGKGIDWVTATGPSNGMASVSIDGVSKGTVDLYTAGVHWQVVEAYAGLASGSHTILVTVLGTKNTSSTGTSALIDAFIVHA